MSSHQPTYQVHTIPHGTLHASVRVPGSKSITNRALCLAGFAHGQSIVENVLVSADSLSCIRCLEALGISLQFHERERVVTIEGCGGVILRQQASLNVDLAGTTARFLTALISTGEGEYFIDAAEQMRRRPMDSLLNVLAEMGATFVYAEQPGHFPLTLYARHLRGGRVEVDSTASSQFVSALLMSAPLCQHDVEITIAGGGATRPSYVDITIAVMRNFGVAVENRDYQTFTIKHGVPYVGTRYLVEPDVSAACYFLAMPILLGGDMLVKDLTLATIQGDRQFFDVIRQLGGAIHEEQDGLRVIGPPDSAFPGLDIDMNSFSDQSLTLAAMAVFADSPTTIRNIAHIRHQESDRITACITELRKLGIRCEDTGDGMTIYPGHPQPATINTYGDHRMAMAFSLIGLRVPGITIADPRCTAKTFPEYFEVLDALYPTGESGS